jgi:hypothetical protein
MRDGDVRPLNVWSRQAMEEPYSRVFPTFLDGFGLEETFAGVARPVGQGLCKFLPWQIRQA